MAAFCASACLFLPALSEAQGTRFAVEEVLSIGGMESDALIMWVGVAVDEAGCIYVTDGLDCSLKKFDAQGRLLGRAGGKGRGQSEFLAPRCLDVFGSRVYVTDQNAPGIKVFDRDLNFIRNIPLPDPVADLQVLDEDRIAVIASSLEKKAKAGVTVYDGRGRVKSQTLYAEGKEAPIMDRVDFVFSPGGDLFVAFNFRDRVERIDPQGRRLWSASLLGLEKSNRKRILFFSVPERFVYKDIARDPWGRLYVLGGGYSDHPSQDVYILSPGGERLGMLRLPHPSHALYVDSRGFLYARADEGSSLKKLKLVEKNEAP